MSNRQRRKSLSIFRPPLQPLTPIRDEPPDSAPAATLKKRRPISCTDDESPMSSPGAQKMERTDSKRSLSRLMTKDRSRGTQKDGRPSSIFGSLRSLSSLKDEDENSAPSPSSMHSAASAIPDVAAGLLIHHGPLPEVSGVFRRRCPYLVLTDLHLTQFKSQGRASEMFPDISGPHGPTKTNLRHSRLSSSSSIHELQGPSDGYYSIPLVHVIAVYKLDDGEPYFSIEVAHLNDNTSSASTMTLQIHDPGESSAWLTAIRSAASKARLTSSIFFPSSLVEYTAKSLEQEQDYHPDHFHMFKVVQRANKSGKRSSSDDLTKLTSKICILAVGMYKIHIVPLPKSAKSPSSTSLSELSGTSHGIVTLSSVNIQTFDDSFQLWFRVPFKPPHALHLAALCVHEVASYVRQATGYLRPEWIEQPFAWIAPSSLSDDALLPLAPEEEDDNLAFDRTLTAYCAGYAIDTSNIRYTINYTCDDAPAFELLPRASIQRPKYSSMELLAIFRALRYNETFHTIRFGGISLDVLNGLCDPHGWEHTPWTRRSGEPVDLGEQQRTSILIQEVRALALKSRRLRRMDFSYCFTRRSSSAGAVPDSGCGICEALFPLCVKQYTNVDWVVLDGNLLADVDIDYLYAAAIEKSSHFRAIEVGHCGLGDRNLEMVLQALSHQGETLETLSCCGNFARLQPLDLREYFDRFSFIRTLDFSNTYRTSGAEPLFAFNTLRRWKLAELSLSGSSINPETLAVLADYLRDPQSNSLKILCLNQCGLTGGNVNDLCRAMTRSTPRQLHLFISENYLEQGHAGLVEAVEQSLTPSQLTMEMLEYRDEENYRFLLQAWARNTSTVYLNMSKVALPLAASTATAAALEAMLANNETLQILNIEGQETHLESAIFGPTLNQALLGLKQNKVLKVLHVEHQKLGMPGANTIASILEENSTLLELHCACNGFSLQAFTVIVSSLKNNSTLLYLPYMEEDREAEFKKWDREFEGGRDSGLRSLTTPTKATVNTMRRSLGAAMPGPLQIANRPVGSPTKQKRQYTQQQADRLLTSINTKWDKEIAMMQGFLQRNHNLAHGSHGLPPENGAAIENERPATGLSARTSMQLGSNETTPLAEPDRQLGAGMGAASDHGDGAVNRLEDDGDTDTALMMSEKLNLD
ncbi:MAG: hypothetical protein Q9185_006762 [Variospora sp. 1 TL-2023]